MSSSSKKTVSVGSILSSLNFLTKDQIQNLVNLKFNNGEEKLSLEDVNFIYEIVWIIKKLGYDVGYNFLSRDWEKELNIESESEIISETGSETISELRKKILFENPLLENAKEKFNVDMNIYKTKVEVQAGEKCKKCGSEETISATKQTRSADEMAQIKITCINCKHRWNAQ